MAQMAVGSLKMVLHFNELSRSAQEVLFLSSSVFMLISIQQLDENHYIAKSNSPGCKLYCLLLIVQFIDDLISVH